MHAGKVVERGAAAKVIQNPDHPYTQLLMRSIPVPDPSEKWDEPEAGHGGEPAAPAGAP